MHAMWMSFALHEFTGKAVLRPRIAAAVRQRGLLGCPCRPPDRNQAIRVIPVGVVRCPRAQRARRSRTPATHLLILPTWTPLTSWGGAAPSALYRIARQSRGWHSASLRFRTTRLDPRLMLSGGTPNKLLLVRHPSVYPRRSIGLPIGAELHAPPSGGVRWRMSVACAMCWWRM